MSRHNTVIFQETPGLEMRCTVNSEAASLEEELCKQSKLDEPLGSAAGRAVGQAGPLSALQSWGQSPLRKATSSKLLHKKPLCAAGTVC